MVEFLIADAAGRDGLCEGNANLIQGARLGDLLFDGIQNERAHFLAAARRVAAECVFQIRRKVNRHSHGNLLVLLCRYGTIIAATKPARTTPRVPYGHSLVGESPISL
ncbi:MAG TPA: hypothetical protein VF278_11425 [Pirellulales bacterium]